MCRTSVLRRLGGFDIDYSPAYFEEADLCVRMHDTRLFATVYDPSVCLVHYEYGSTSTSRVERDDAAQPSDLSPQERRIPAPQEASTCRRWKPPRARWRPARSASCSSRTGCRSVISARASPARTTSSTRWRNSGITSRYTRSTGRPRRSRPCSSRSPIRSKSSTTASCRTSRRS